MSIVVVAGNPRNGKGLYCMSILEQAVAAGRPCYTNIELLPGCPFYERVARLEDPADDRWPVYRGRPPREGKRASDDYCAFWHYVRPGGVVVVDEADAYFDCSDHSAVGHDIRLFHKQHGKLGLDLIYVVQNTTNLYVRIRKLAQRFVLCEWTWRSRRFFQRLAGIVGVDRAMYLSNFVRTEFSSQDFSDKSLMTDVAIPYPQIRDRYFLNGGRGPWYRTEQLLGDVSHLRWMNGLLPGAAPDRVDHGQPGTDAPAAGGAVNEWRPFVRGDDPRLGAGEEAA